MRFREKSAWACLVTTIAVFVPYFAYVLALFRRGELSPGAVMTAFMAAVAFQIALNVIAHIGLSVRGGQEKRDERAVAIESKSFKNAYVVLVATLVVAIIGVTVFAVAPRSAYTGPAMALTFLSQVILLCVILAETAKYSTRAVCYRRGS